jgi:hypothetical protein
VFHSELTWLFSVISAQKRLGTAVEGMQRPLCARALSRHSIVVVSHAS